MPALSDSINLLNNIGFIEVIGTFLITYTIMQVILKYSGLLKLEGKEGAKEMISAISFAAALLVVGSSTGRKIMANVVSYFTVYAIVLFFLVILLLSIGYTPDDVSTVVKPGGVSKTGWWGIVWGIGALVLVMAIGTSFPDVQQADIEQSAVNANQSVAEYIQDLGTAERIIYFTSLPQVLGIIILFIIFALAGAVIAADPNKGLKP